MIESMRNAGLDPGSIIADGILHRFDVPGDRPKSFNGWYVMYDGAIQAGSFGSWKTGQLEKWCSKSADEFTPEEKKEYAARMRAVKEKKEAEQALVYEKCRAESLAKWNAAPDATDDHPYLIAKGVKSYGLKQSGEALMIPVKVLKGGTMKGIQYIFPDGSKKFKTGTEKKGAFCMIGRPVENTLIVCEGYATGASIHEATGHAVLVAFDCGNLEPVAVDVRANKPDWNIIIAADNDQWTDGNPGVTHAQKAAVSAKCSMVIPLFVDKSTKPTDFNDLHRLHGLTAVKVCIFPPPEEDFDHDFSDPDKEYDPYSEDSTPCPFRDFPFLLLGHNRGEYYYLPHSTRQIKVMRASEHTKSNLIELAPLQVWESSDFNGGKSGAMNVDKTLNAMLKRSHDRGIFDPDKIRGRGAWFDEGRAIVHVGNKLIVDGKETPFNAFKSKYIYERSIEINLGIGTKELTNAQALELETLCNALSWQKSDVSGKLLAGWCALSAICGALDWRPHIQITGGAGTGKSWIIDNIVRRVAGAGALIVQGATSEAGIRQCLGADSRPVIFDEAEGEDQKAHARMQSILELARQASSETGGSIYKGSTSGKAQSFRIRSMFCFASISMSQTQQADQSRISVLTLKNKHDGGKHWRENIVPLWNRIMTDEFCSALRARMVKVMPMVVPNAKIFSDAVGEAAQNKRDGDQYGTLLAGNWALRSTNIVPVEEAKKIANSIDWNSNKVLADQSDEMRCLNVMLETLTVMPDGNRVSIAEHIRIATSTVIINEDCDSQKTLKNHGFKAVQGGFCVANQHKELQKIMERTPWPANWGQIISRLPMAQPTDKTIYFSGASVRAIMLPLSYVMES